MKLSKILAPVSRSESSANGLKYAIRLAKVTDSELDIFHVQREAELEKTKFSYEDFFKKELGDVLYKEIFRIGETSSEIVQMASELEPEMIVMSPDVFKKEKKYFEESETGKILKQSGYPVLMIPPGTEFKEINSVVLVADIRENIIESVQELLKLFRNVSPAINVLVFSEKDSSWHFKEDLLDLIKRIKNYTEYENISGKVSEGQNKCAGLEQFAMEVKADLICMERNTDIFHKLFFQCKTNGRILYLQHKPILVLPRYWEDSF